MKIKIMNRLRYHLVDTAGFQPRMGTDDQLQRWSQNISSATEDTEEMDSKGTNAMYTKLFI